MTTEHKPHSDLIATIHNGLWDGHLSTPEARLHARIALRNLEEQLETLDAAARHFIFQVDLYLGPLPGPVEEAYDVLDAVLRAQIGPHETLGICDHVWSIPSATPVFRCMKCGIERTELSPATSDPFTGEPGPEDVSMYVDPDPASERP